MDHDRNVVDLVVVIGTSLKVAPVSEVVGILPKDVPQLYISREVGSKSIPPIVCANLNNSHAHMSSSTSICSETAIRSSRSFADVLVGTWSTR